ncbi:cytochrome oxidase putative small subunit CydP [Legionella sp.]
MTLVIKLLLLFLLWWVCVRTMHPQLEKGSSWLLGSQEKSVLIKKQEVFK